MLTAVRTHLKERHEQHHEHPLLADILKAQQENNGPVTAKEAHTNAVYIARLASKGLVRTVAARQTGKRGRPAVQVVLTDKGRKRAKRVLSAA